MNENLFGGDEKALTMELERNIRSIANKVHSSNPASNKGTPLVNANQGIASLLVMLAVLTIIILFCCFSAPGIRGLCKRPASTIPESTTPTVILLPCGRMLVVDRNVFSQLHADQSGIDLLELSANLIRSQNTFRQGRQVTGSTPSILDSDTTSKGMSPTSLGYGPPAYEDIFGLRDLDLPPSYSEVSFIMGNQRVVTSSSECIEMGEIRREEVGEGNTEAQGEENGERTIVEEESDVVCVNVNSVERESEKEMRVNEDSV